MKIRLDYVTNSSSSSFILMFKSKEEMKSSYGYICERFGKDFADIIYKDIRENKRTKAQVLEVLKEEYMTEGREQVIFTDEYYELGRRGYYAKYGEANLNKQVNKYVKSKLALDEEKMPSRCYFAVMEYDTDLLEDVIMPSLPFTFKCISHH